jgi:hypothetical protein
LLGVVDRLGEAINDVWRETDHWLNMPSSTSFMVLAWPTLDDLARVGQGVEMYRRTERQI